MTAQIDAEPRTHLGRCDGMAAAHRCAGGRSCRDPVVDGEDRQPALIEAPRGLCRRCTGAVTAAVEALAGDYATLAEAWGERPTGARDHVSGTPEPPIPINVSIEALGRSLGEWADVALAMVAAALGITHPEPYRGKGHPRRYDRIVVAATGVVGPNVDLLLAAPAESTLTWNRDGTSWHVTEADGIAIGLKLAWLHRQVIAALGDANPRTWLAMPCPVLDCGAQTLGQSNGSTDVTCTSCGGRWTERDYAWLAGFIISELDHRPPGTDATALVKEILR